MNGSSNEIWVAIIGAVGLVLTNLLTGVVTFARAAGSRHVKAVDEISKGYAELLEQYRMVNDRYLEEMMKMSERTSAVEMTLRKVQLELQSVRAHVEALENQLKVNGIAPIPRPDTRLKLSIEDHL